MIESDESIIKNGGLGPYTLQFMVGWDPIPFC